MDVRDDAPSGAVTGPHVRDRLERDGLLVATKLTTPTPPANAVVRDRLLERLLTGSGDRRLAIVAAPAGYGKTTLLAQLTDAATARGLTAAWIAVDGDDVDTARLLRHLAVALLPADRVATVLERAESLAEDPRRATEAFALALRDLPPRVLVVDDLHQVAQPRSEQMVIALRDALPAGSLLAIGTRHRPAVHLAAARLRGDLLELDTEDLAFHRDEAAALLGDAAIQDGVLDAAIARTEGWPAALRVARLAHDDRCAGADPPLLHGGDRDLVDYLGETVLDAVDDTTLDFLLATAVVDRFTPELANELTGRGDGHERIRQLHERGLFTIPLDRHGTWYRYHQLFQDALRIRGRQQDPERTRRWLCTATTWFDDHGFTSEAIRTAFDSGETGRAAALAARVSLHLAQQHGAHGTVLRWAAGLTDEELADHPQLLEAVAWSATFTTDLERAEHLLDLAENVPVATRTDDGIPWTEMLRCVLTGLSDDLPGTERRCRDWLAAHGEGDAFASGTVTAALGYSLLARFRFDEAASTLDHALIAFRTAETRYGVSWACALRGSLELERGQVDAADTVLTTGSEQVGGQGTYAWSLLAAVAADVAWERGDDETALAASHDALQRGAEHGVVETTLAAARARSDILAARGDLDAALDVLRATEVAARRRQLWRLVEAIRYQRILVLLAAGRADPARNEREDLTGDDPPPGSLTRPLALEAAARFGLLTGDLGSAARALRLWRAEARRTGRVRSAARALAASAVLDDRSRERERALRNLDQAVTLASGGLLRTLLAVDADRVADLAAHSRRRSGGHLDRLLAVHRGDGGRSARPPDAPRPTDANLHSVGGLTSREHEMLVLVADGLPNADIAARLYVSIDTVKWHLSNAYRKLGVSSRTAAAARLRATDVAVQAPPGRLPGH